MSQLSNKNLNLINKVSNLFLRAKLVVEGFIIGLHKSPYHGFSVEFSEHKSYGYGDETKYIDWKLWAKTDKLFIKQFEEETNLKCHIIFDKSSSMGYSSKKITKFEYSKDLAAALSYLMIKQQDAVGLHMFDDKIKISIPPKSKKSHLNLILSNLHNTSFSGKTKISTTLHHLADSIKKKGLVILISDLFDIQNDVISGLKHFRYKGHEVIVFHILDLQEVELDFNRSIEFFDLESNESLLTDPKHINIDYKKAVNRFCKKYKYECEKNKIDYVNILTNDSLEKSLIEYLIKRKKIN
tara:strand:- start:39 stop:929 length:891 start_codon:yes stop_codon:yes gene_type:complete